MQKKGIVRRIRGGSHVHLHTFKFEFAVNNTGPQLKPLFDVGYVFGFCSRTKVETNLPEMKLMRVLAEVVIQLLLAFAAGAVADFTAVRVVVGKFVSLADETLGHRAGVPAPLRHCAKRCGLLVKFGKGLQAGYIACEDKFAVADRERRERLEFSQDRIMARDKRTAVDGRCLLSAAARCDLRECAACDDRADESSSCDLGLVQLLVSAVFSK